MVDPAVHLIRLLLLSLALLTHLEIRKYVQKEPHTECPQKKVVDPALQLFHPFLLSHTLLPHLETRQNVQKVPHGFSL